MSCSLIQKVKCDQVLETLSVLVMPDYLLEVQQEEFITAEQFNLSCFFEYVISVYSHIHFIGCGRYWHSITGVKEDKLSNLIKVPQLPGENQAWTQVFWFEVQGQRFSQNNRVLPVNFGLPQSSNFAPLKFTKTVTIVCLRNKQTYKQNTWYKYKMWKLQHNQLLCSFFKRL